MLTTILLCILAAIVMFVVACAAIALAFFFPVLFIASLFISGISPETRRKR